MTILDGMNQATVLDATLHYLEAGVSVLPVTGKQNAVAWAKFQTTRPTPGLVHWWHEKGKLKGVGIICGRVSGNLAVIDCDGDAAVAEYEKTFPHLLDTLTVISGSRHGRHYYYFTDTYTPTTRTKGWELRSDGCYVVAPPSIHPVSCLAYVVARGVEPRRLPTLGAVQAWIASKFIQNRPTAKPANQPSSYSTRYADTALESECDRIALATAGTRNQALFLGALRMGNLIDLGLIDVGTVTNALMRAAVSDDTDAQKQRTIQSGIARGINSNKRVTR